MSGCGAESRVKDYQAVVGAGRIGCGGDTDSVLGGEMDIEGGGDRRDKDGYRLTWWDNNVVQVSLKTDPNAHFAYVLVLEHHHLITSTPGDPGV